MLAEEESTFNPPDAGRVAARAMVLSAVSCRGFVEKDANKPGAEELRRRVVKWLALIGITEEVEPAEAKLLSTRLGQLDPKTTMNASWQSEGMVVLAWALDYAILPLVHLECDPPEIANRMGFLDDRENTPLHSPRLRDSSEIERWADIYLTLYWRLRQFSAHPGLMDFLGYVSSCTIAKSPSKISRPSTLNGPQLRRIGGIQKPLRLRIF